MVALPIELSPGEIESFCRKWKIREFALFGSILPDDFGPHSDVDVFVEFDDSATWTLWDVMKAEQELAERLGRNVDLIER